jgi:predicted NBD/HSP70 family sugar kinase
MNQLSELVSVLPRVLLPATGWLNVSDHQRNMSKENDSRPDIGENPPANPGRSRFAVNTTRLLRDVNARQCLAVLRDKGPLSRAEIARVLGITRATAGNAMRELIASGLVTDAGETNDIAQVGRPGANLHLDPEGAFFIGVEVQKKLLTIQLFNFTLAVCATRNVPVSIDLNRVHTIASKIAETSLALIGDASLPPEKIYGLGVSVPGIVSSAGQVIIPSVPKWEGVDLKALLSAQLPKYWLVKICNNAAAVAFSLCESLPEKDQQDFLFILLSQGVGSALVRHGKVEKGSHGFAGEIGHLLTNPRLSRQGKPFESLASYERFLPFLDREKTPAEALQELATQPNFNKRLETILVDWADVLSAGLLNAIHMLDPGHIMLGGPTAVLYPKVESRVLATLRRGLLPGLEVPRVRLAGSSSSEVSGGAAAYIRQELFRVPDLQSGSGFY